VVTSQIVKALLRWFRRNARDLPWRRTRDPYAIWVSEIMLQQTQVKTVLPYWERWMRALPTIEAVARAEARTIHKLWEGLGYYTRVRNMQKAAQEVVERLEGRFPERFEDVRELPGIGRYTAGAICSIAFNQPKPVLDGNIIRVLSRLFGVRGNPRAPKVNARLWALAEELVLGAAELEKRGGKGRPFESIPQEQRPAGACSQLNQALMELGALVCRPREAQCRTCPVARGCVAFRTGRVEALPGTPARPRSTRRRFAAFIFQKKGKLLVRQRPAGVVNAHLWELPNVELMPGDGNLEEAARLALGIRPGSLERFGCIQHTITRYCITLEVFRAAPTRKVPCRGSGRWADPRELKHLPFTAAHKKILDRLELERGPGRW